VSTFDAFYAGDGEVATASTMPFAARTKGAELIIVCQCVIIWFGGRHLSDKSHIPIQDERERDESYYIFFSLAINYFISI
jgi:hypothetical protein